MPRTRTEIDNKRVAKVLSHPLRFRILERLNEREASPSEIAKYLNEPLGNVSYHFKVLEQYDAVELVGTRPVRGALEHIYRASARPYLNGDEWSKLPQSVRNQIFGGLLETAWQHVARAATAGGFDDADTHVSWTNLDLDRQGYDEMVELLVSTLDRALEIKAEAAGRLVELSPDVREVRRTELTILYYDSPPGTLSVDRW